MIKIVKRGKKSIRKKLYAMINEIVGYDLDGEPYYEFADNYRFCEVGNKEDEALYQRICDGGCCGFYDTEVIFEDKKYMVGFNYGH